MSHPGPACTQLPNEGDSSWPIKQLFLKCEKLSLVPSHQFSMVAEADRLSWTATKYGKAPAESQQRKAIQILTLGPAETIRSLGEEAADL